MVAKTGQRDVASDVNLNQPVQFWRQAYLPVIVRGVPEPQTQPLLTQCPQVGKDFDDGSPAATTFCLSDVQIQGQFRRRQRTSMLRPQIVRATHSHQHRFVPVAQCHLLQGLKVIHVLF